MDWKTIEQAFSKVPETMDIYAKKGSKVKFAYPTFGYQYEQEKALRFLTIGATYTVDHTEVHSSFTHVYLKEVPEISFNSVFFEDLSINKNGGKQIC